VLPIDKDVFKSVLRGRPDMAELMSQVMSNRRIELETVREGLDAETRRRRVKEERSEILSSIQTFSDWTTTRSSSTPGLTPFFQNRYPPPRQTRPGGLPCARCGLRPRSSPSSSSLPTRFARTTWSHVSGDFTASRRRRFRRQWGICTHEFTGGFPSTYDFVMDTLVPIGKTGLSRYTGTA